MREHGVLLSVGEPHLGIAAPVGVCVRLGGDRGQPITASGVTLPDALRRLARRVEEIEALGPLEREPRRRAAQALRAARIELIRLNTFLDWRCDLEVLHQLVDARAALEDDIGLDVELKLEDQEGGRAR